MKIKRILSAVLCALLTAGTLMLTYASAEEAATSVTKTYSDFCQGSVDKKDNVTVTKGEKVDGKTAVKVVPNPSGTTASSQIRLDSWELDKYKFDLAVYDYVIVEYKYDTESPNYTGKMQLDLRGNKCALEKSVAVSSVSPLATGGWKTAVFEIGSKTKTLLTKEGVSTNLWQLHIMPFSGTGANKLTESDVLYIGDITFTTEKPEGVEVVTTPTENTTTTTPVTTPTTGNITGQSVTSAYADGMAKGRVDSQKTSNVEIGVEYEGKKTVKVTPDPAGEDAGKIQIKIDAYELSAKKIDLAVYNYMIVEYKYDTTTPTFNGKMQVNLLPSKSAMSKSMAYNSMDPVTAGSWNTAVFNISNVKSVLTRTENPTLLWQFHFSPFGTTTPKNLKATDVMYIGNITFTTDNPDPDRLYKVEFTGGGATEGTAPATLQLKEGDKFTMPECTYKMGDSEFGGWMNTADSTLLQPGKEMTMPANDLSFFPKWEVKVVVPDVKVLNYPAYYNGIIDKAKKFHDISLGEETVTVDGIEAIMAMPNPEATTGTYFGYDGWSYSGAGIDTTEYKYAAILYKFDAANIHEDFRTVFKVLRGGFTKGQTFTTEQPLKYGQWDIVTFDFTSAAEFVNPDNPIIAQCHLLPFQEGKIKELDVGDKFYISKLMFFKEKPENISVHAQFIKGYEDGTFKPSGTMTRAEACTIVTRLLSTESAIKGKYTSNFTDVNAGDWYHDNIAYLESLGLLKSYSGVFAPNQAITRAEFVELVYNMGLLTGGENNGVFTDVAADHPRYNVITAAGKAGLVNGYANGDGTFSFKPDATISRAEVVKVINNAYGKKLYKNEYIAKFDVAPIFNDVALDHWAYTDIMEATLPHGTYETSDKGEEWFYMSTPDIPVDYNAGNAKAAEVEALAEKRKAEIRATASKEFNITGTKYYVSNDGNDENDGKSPETAWATIAKVNSSKSSMNSGDAVYFNRGDMFRGHLSTLAGVTYSAYGEGAKPIIAGSPENGTGEEKWSLLEGTTNIWVYKDKMVDVGGLVVNKGAEDYLLEKRAISYFDNATGKYFHDKAHTKEFDPVTELENNTFFNNQGSKDVTSALGDLYLRCDEGNPGKLYSSIEFLHGSAAVIAATSNVTIDNLAVMYGGRHGIGAGTVNNLVITNCEIGWIGGGIQNYNSGALVRFGNGVEVYGGCDNFVIDNCYVYQCFDAGITNQYQKGGANAVIEKDVTFTNNLIEYCCYNIEYFMGVADTNVTRLLQNVLYENNICRMAGFGWGRVNPTNAAHIKGWDHYNMADNFVIKNNIFDRSYGDLLHIGTKQLGWFPKMSGNTYIQYKDSAFGHIGQIATTFFPYNASTISEVASVLPDDTHAFYFLQPIKK